MMENTITQINKMTNMKNPNNQDKENNSMANKNQSQMEKNNRFLTKQELENERKKFEKIIDDTRESFKAAHPIGFQAGSNEGWNAIWDKMLSDEISRKLRRKPDTTKRGCPDTKKSQPDAENVCEAADGQFRFLINMSVGGYENKQKAKKSIGRNMAKEEGVAQMAYREVWLTIDEFIDKATRGYAFCGLFRFMYEKYEYSSFASKIWCQFIKLFYSIKKVLKFV